MVASSMEIDLQSRTRSTEPSVLIMGMGATGASCARYFATLGIAAEFIDTREHPPGMHQILDAMPDARIHTGGHVAALRESIERIVISPGVDLESPLIKVGRTRRLDIVSDIDLFIAECKAPLIAVTGSNGKSTVVSMAGSILSAAGTRIAVGGNLGTPALDLLDSDVELYVLELSSFQLERSAPVPSAAAVILNITPDHLDQHVDMDAYSAAKARIYLSCDHAIVNRDFPELSDLVPSGTDVTTFGMDHPATGEFGIRTTPRGECIALGDALLLAVDELPLPGRHNLSNAMAALALGVAVGVSSAGMAQALKRYRGLPHRLQVVSDARGIQWIDDSKATNVDAAVRSIASVADPFVLIAGGDAKSARFAALADALRGRDCRVILLGRDAADIAGQLGGTGDARIVDTMQAAVESAAAAAKPGATVLLAPACSSLDMFDGFAARGNAFAAAIRGLGS